MLLAAYGGLRWSEGIGLCRGRVEGNRVRVVEQYVRRADGKWYRDEPKTDAGRRSVTLPIVAADALAGHLDDWAQPDGLVFVNQRGNPINIHNFTGMVFKPALTRAGLDPGVRIHDLHHIAVAPARRRSKARMGHASISVTLDRYGHLYPEMDADLAAGLDRLITRAPRCRPSDDIAAVPGLLEVVERPGRCELVVTGTGEAPRARVELAAAEADLLARLAGGGGC